MKQKYDVVIIGGGIIGSVIAYQLAKYNLKTVLLEKNPVFADETTRGNSGVIHGGFDPDPHKIEARLNVLGNKMWREEIFKHLDFPRAQVDSLILAFNDDEMDDVHMLYERGLTNGVLKEDMQILNTQQVLKKEPNINHNVKGALLCTSSWAIDPVKATLAFLGAAQQNGTELRKNANVTKIKYSNDQFEITINNNELITSKNIINAAGHYADKIAELANYPDFKQTTRRGEYRILDRSLNGIVNSICFMVPTIHGKGVVVAPMLDGHVLVGPTAEEGIDKQDTRLITEAKFKYIGEIGKKIIPSLDMSKTIMTLAGSRPIDIKTNDFVIGYAKQNNHFINAAGMQSPAIASAPAIALEIEELLRKNDTKLDLNKNYNPNFKIFY
ncbi:type 2 glycerol-3-phosphate oxidase [Mycoplasma sp. E35C]|uniref:type 2 glycerol-3-phosphate oxidase n=1 Tax=Mycoplasma sp. E35C TaxID=2801918 RepID=UPI001CA3AE38|nr:type 2 glycerol-3-phosphate oxidase [Mycoplasma sp. E35C]QZX48863.1 type 2 glycerol-3-phosphate oxidase [Mycoplasma sp. E35C]